jgi:hypothetical protein
VDLSSLVPLSGGNPLKVLILSSWKSGSTLLTDFVASHPAAFLHFEPFSWFGVRRMRKPDQVEKAAAAISELFNCDYRQHLGEK